MKLGNIGGVERESGPETHRAVSKIRGAMESLRKQYDDSARQIAIWARGIYALGNVPSGNYVQVDEETGALRFMGESTTWEDLRVPVTATTRGGSKDPGFDVWKTNGSGSQGVFTYWFDKAAEEELYFTVQFPHSYKEGSRIYPHVHWTPKTTDSGKKVSWGFEYNWANVGDVFGNTSIIYGDTPILSLDAVANTHIITPLGTNGIDGTGKKISSMMACRIFRDATGAGGTDDYNYDAGLLQFDIHYEVDSTGSDEEFTKG